LGRKFGKKGAVQKGKKKGGLKKGKKGKGTPVATVGRDKHPRDRPSKKGTE